MDDSILMILIIALCFSPIILLLAIVIGAYFSRKAKRKKIMNNLPADAKIKAPVRINSDKYQHRWLKFKGFQASGVIYISDGNIIIEGYKKKVLKYNLRTVQLAWEGTDFMKSGLLQWFMINNNEGDKYYINIETGVLVLELGTKVTTQGLYTILRNEQSDIINTPPPVKD